MADCIFCKIGNGEMKSKLLYKGDRAFVIRDINPQAPVHLLVIPFEHIPTIGHITPEQEPLVGHLVNVANEAARAHSLGEKGYRLQINCNRDGGQTVYHLHIHVFGGRQLGPLLCKHWEPLPPKAKA